MTLDELCRTTPSIDLIVIYNSLDFKGNVESYLYDSNKYLDEITLQWIPEEYYDYHVYQIKPLDEMRLLVLIKE